MIGKVTEIYQTEENSFVRSVEWELFTILLGTMNLIQKLGVRVVSDLARAAAAILRTSRPLSPEFREQAAQMIEALDECVSNLLMTEQVHQTAGQPFYSKGLEMGRVVLQIAAKNHQTLAEMSRKEQGILNEKPQSLPLRPHGLRLQRRRSNLARTSKEPSE